MICRSCLRRASSVKSALSLSRPFTSYSSLRQPATETASPRTSTHASAISSGISQPFSSPLSPQSNAVSPSSELQSTQKPTQIPVSSCPAGTVMKGLNYFKGKDDIVALPEADYPEWLWRCLDVKTVEDDKLANAGDEFAKSKKLRRKAAKAQRKLQAKLLASGDLSALQPKIPVTRQSIDLPANEEGTTEGALKAARKREELRSAMRDERRSKIKETNYLKAM